MLASENKNFIQVYTEAITYAEHIMTTSSIIHAHKELHQFLSNRSQFTGHVFLSQHSNILIKSPYGNTPHLQAPFPIGSLTKSFMGALCYQLEKHYLLNLDIPLSTYFPSAAQRYTQLASCTPRHLLRHTSGLMDFSDDPIFFTEDLLCYPHTAASLFLAICKRPTLFAPGEAYHRSRLGYIVLTHLLQCITTQSLPQLMQQYVLDPLELRDTQCITEEHSPIYKNWDPSVTMGWGNILSTMEDLVQWLDAIFVQQFAPYETTTVPRFLQPKDSIHIGLGWDKCSFHQHISYRNGFHHYSFPFLTALYIPKIQTKLLLLSHPSEEKDRESIETFIEAILKKYSAL